MRRPAAVAGQFYHAEASKLREQVARYMKPDAPKERVIAALCPHAGLIYSGSVAAAVFSRMEPPEGGTFILIGPNHTGLGAPVSMMAEGIWEIPTGTAPIDERLAALIARESPLIRKDARAHMFEHSLEVQLPFMLYMSKSVNIVPITVMSGSLPELISIGEAIARAAGKIDYPTVIIASSDMSHYVPDNVARRKDRMAIDMMLALDAEGLYSTVIKENISMCGYMPSAIMLAAAAALGAREARLVKYSTSAEVSGDYDHVVGYAGILIK